MAVAAVPLRVSIGEDDLLLRRGISRVLMDAGFDVVAEAGDADDLLGKTLAYRPDVAVVDVQMPPRREDDGLRAAIQLRRRLPGLGVLLLSQFCEPDFALQLIGDDAHGVGYLLKERVGDIDTFADAVIRVANGGSALDAEVIDRMLQPRVTTDALGVLTARERDVLQAMAEGRSNLGITRALLISEAAVEKYVTSIFRKLSIGPAEMDNRRVRAVLVYLSQTQAGV